MDSNGTGPDQLQDELQVPPAQDPPVPRLLAMVLRYRFALLVATVVAALLAVVPAGQLRFDQSIESLYAQDNPHLAAFRASRELFGGDEFVIVSYEDPQLLSLIHI